MNNYIYTGGLPSYLFESDITTLTPGRLYPGIIRPKGCKLLVTELVRNFPECWEASTIQLMTLWLVTFTLPDSEGKKVLNTKIVAAENEGVAATKIEEYFFDTNLLEITFFTTAIL